MPIFVMISKCSNIRHSLHANGTGRGNAGLLHSFTLVAKRGKRPCYDLCLMLSLPEKITLPLSCLALRFSPCRPSARHFSVAQLPLHVLSPFVVSRHRLCLISNSYSYDQTKAFIFNRQGEGGRVTMHDGGARADVLCQQLCVYIRGT